MSKVQIKLNINNTIYDLSIEPSATLIEALRDGLHLLGTKENCLEGECGACTVLVNDKAVNSCIYLAMRAQGKCIETIEGLAKNGQLHPVQQAFIDEGAIQCGYCTPGFVMSTIALLRENLNPTDIEIDEALAGNICRCTGYTNIHKAVRTAAIRIGGEQ